MAEMRPRLSAEHERLMRETVQLPWAYGSPVAQLLDELDAVRAELKATTRERDQAEKLAVLWNSAADETVSKLERHSSTIERLTDLLKEAHQFVCSEVCSVVHHEFCIGLKQALTASESVKEESK